MANPDLRDWLAQMEAAGEVQKVSGAERMEEIGGIVDIYQRRPTAPLCCSTTSPAIRAVIGWRRIS